jgi:hypothetical protein
MTKCRFRRLDQSNVFWIAFPCRPRHSSMSAAQTFWRPRTELAILMAMSPTLPVFCRRLSRAILLPGAATAAGV